MNDVIIFFAIIIGAILSVAGIAGCIIPALPGPPLNYVALVILKFAAPESFSFSFLITWGILTLIVVVLDYVLPIVGAKRYNASRYGIWGSIIGMLIGIIFFPPWGMITGLLIGAIIGELIAGKENSEALRVGLATFFSSLIMIIVKLVISGILTFFFILESVKALV